MKIDFSKIQSKSICELDTRIKEHDSFMLAQRAGKWDASRKQQINVRDYLYFDIETVSEYKDFDTFCKESPLQIEPFKKKILNFYDGDINDINYNSLYQEKAGLLPEYGKIVSISIAIEKKGEWYQFNFNGDEETLLKNFNAYIDLTVKRANAYKELSKFYYNGEFKNLKLCGANIIYFDIPYIAKRCEHFKIVPNENIYSNTRTKFETDHILDLTVFFRKNSTIGDNGIHAICAFFGIPTPKDVISGKDVSAVYHGYYHDKSISIDEIYTYCDKDVIVMIEILEHLQNNFKSYTF